LTPLMDGLMIHMNEENDFFFWRQFHPRIIFLWL
jgi:hypothetical protein